MHYPVNLTFTGFFVFIPYVNPFWRLEVGFFFNNFFIIPVLSYRFDPLFQTCFGIIQLTIPNYLSIRCLKNEIIFITVGLFMFVTVK